MAPENKSVRSDDVLFSTVANRILSFFGGRIDTSRVLHANDHGQIEQITYQVGHTPDMTPSEAFEALSQPGMKVADR